VDEVDIRICQMLMRDSRTAYRELADALGLSVAAVHSRVEKLVGDGVIRRFTVNLSMACQGVVPVVIFGRSELPSADSASGPLSQDGSTYAYLVGAGNMVYVCGFLRSRAELDGYAEHARTVADIIDPTVAVETMGPPGDLAAIRSPACRRISPLDGRIIDALRPDSRKALTEVAEELGVTAKTVKRHWDRLEAEGLVEKTIQWNPDSSGDIIVFLHLDLAEGTERHGLGNILMSKYGPNVMFFRIFSNLPSFLQLILWGRSLREVKGVMEDIEREGSVRKAHSHIVYKGYWFQTWMDLPTAFTDDPDAPDD
jgi:DNA-binding Lrp family transcriptional regulator